MKKMILAVALLLCFVLVAASCNPDSPYELKTNENGDVVTNENGEPETVKKNDNGDANNGGGIQIEKDPEEGFCELNTVGR